MPPTEDPACNTCMCPDWELNQRPFGSQATLNPPHQPGPVSSVLIYLLLPLQLYIFSCHLWIVNILNLNIYFLDILYPIVLRICFFKCFSLGHSLAKIVSYPNYICSQSYISQLDIQVPYSLAIWFLSFLTWCLIKAFHFCSRGVHPFGVSGPHWKKKSCLGSHIKYVATSNHKKIS